MTSGMYTARGWIVNSTPSFRYVSAVALVERASKRAYFDLTRVNVRISEAMLGGATPELLIVCPVG
jgi:hypothetical protein